MLISKYSNNKEDKNVFFLFYNKKAVQIILIKKAMKSIFSFRMRIETV